MTYFNCCTMRKPITFALMRGNWLRQGLGLHQQEIDGRKESDPLGTLVYFWDVLAPSNEMLSCHHWLCLPNDFSFIHSAKYFLKVWDTFQHQTGLFRFRKRYQHWPGPKVQKHIQLYIVSSRHTSPMTYFLDCGQLFSELPVMHINELLLLLAKLQQGSQVFLQYTWNPVRLKAQHFLFGLSRSWPRI